jgi:hypothetical protein
MSCVGPGHRHFYRDHFACQLDFANYRSRANAGDQFASIFATPTCEFVGKCCVCFASVHMLRLSDA